MSLWMVLYCNGSPIISLFERFFSTLHDDLQLLSTFIIYTSNWHIWNIEAPSIYVPSLYAHIRKVHIQKHFRICTFFICAYKEAFSYMHLLYMRIYGRCIYGSTFRESRICAYTKGEYTKVHILKVIYVHIWKFI